ncbi:Protein nedd1 [Thoreauomyces humboldtii]|nr:Protein nedd1 [Thoreauomyces humboldtii]
MSESTTIVLATASALSFRTWQLSFPSQDAGNLSHQQASLVSLTNRATDICYSRSGSHLAVATTSGVSIYDRSGKLAEVVPAGPRDELNAVGFLGPNARTVVLAGAQKVLKSWDREKKAFTSMLRSITQLRFSPDRRSLLFAVCDDGSVAYWDVDKRREPMHVFRDAHQAPVRGIALGLEGFTCTVGMDRKLHIYDLKTHAIVTTFDAKVALTSCSSILIYSVHENGVIATLKSAVDTDPITSVAFRPISSASKSGDSATTVNFQLDQNNLKAAKGAEADSVARHGSAAPAAELSRPVPRVMASVVTDKAQRDEFMGMFSPVAVPGKKAALPDGIKRDVQSKTSREPLNARLAELAKASSSARAKTARPLNESESKEGTKQIQPISSQLRRSEGPKQLEDRRISRTEEDSLDKTQVRTQEAQKIPIQDETSRSGSRVEVTGRTRTARIETQPAVAQPSSDPDVRRTSVAASRVSVSSKHRTELRDVALAPRSASKDNAFIVDGHVSLSRKEQSIAVPLTSVRAADEPDDVSKPEKSILGPFINAEDDVKRSRTRSKLVPNGRHPASTTSVATDRPDADATGKVDARSRVHSGDSNTYRSTHKQLTAPLSHHTTTAAPSLLAPAPAAAVPVNFSHQLLESVVTDCMEDLRTQIRRDVHNVHLDLLKQFWIQKQEVEDMFRRHGVAESMEEELRSLREENARLRRNY